MLEETSLIDKLSKVITASSLENPVDYQGIIADAGSDAQYRTYYHNVVSIIKPTFGVKNTKSYQDRSPVQLRKIHHFVKFFPIKNISNNHFQLHNSLVAVTEKDVMYLTSQSICVYNTANGTNKKIIDVKNPKCVDYDAETELLLTTDRQHAVIYNTRLQKRVENLKFYEDDNTIGRISFHRHNNTPFVTVIGNDTDNFIWDPTAEKIAFKFTTSAFGNDIDYNQNNQVFAVALDDMHIDLIDVRDKGSLQRTKLHGHQDFNFAVTFMGDNYLASGGQDLTTRIWDIRVQKPMFTIKSDRFGIYSLKYSSATKILSVLEGYLNFSSYYFDGSDAIGTTDVLLGEMTGMALTPSERGLFIGTFHIKSGIAKFELCN